MKFAVLVALLAAGVSASLQAPEPKSEPAKDSKPEPAKDHGDKDSHPGKVDYTTVVVDKYTTYCPSPTTITYAQKTYTVTAATTLTIEGPCTVTKPIYTTTKVVCNDCAESTYKPAPSAPAPAPAKPVVKAGAEKAIAMSGTGLLGLVGLVLAL